MTAAAAPSLAGLHGAGQRRPLYSRLPVLYFAMPAWTRSFARWLVGSRHGGRALVDRYLARLAGWPAGDGRPVPLLLTHDVDTPEGYRTLPRLLEAEEALGLASLSLMVTHRYGWEPARLAALAERGHRFGVHDTTHDNRLAYLPPAQVSARIRRAQQALGPLDSGAFRAPAFLRTRGLYEGIAPVVRVDLSAIDWALLWPHPGDGMGSPFPVRYGPMTCVPTTLPRDGELIALGLRPREAADVCRTKALALHRVGAPAVLLTHPDPTFTDGAERIAAYADLLAGLRDSGRFLLLPPAAALAELCRRARVDIAAPAR